MSYCGAYPPPPEPRMSNCVKSAGHNGEHRNIRGFTWPVAKEEK